MRARGLAVKQARDCALVQQVVGRISRVRQLVAAVCAYVPSIHKSLLDLAELRSVVLCLGV